VGYRKGSFKKIGRKSTMKHNTLGSIYFGSLSKGSSTRRLRFHKKKPGKYFKRFLTYLIMGGFIAAMVGLTWYNKCVIDYQSIVIENIAQNQGQWGEYALGAKELANKNDQDLFWQWKAIDDLYIALAQIVWQLDELKYKQSQNKKDPPQ